MGIAVLSTPQLHLLECYPRRLSLWTQPDISHENQPWLSSAMRTDLTKCRNKSISGILVLYYCSHLGLNTEILLLLLFLFDRAQIFFNLSKFCPQLREKSQNSEFNVLLSQGNNHKMKLDIKCPCLFSQSLRNFGLSGSLLFVRKKCQFVSQRNVALVT